MITIHPTALVASSLIGDGTRIWAFVNILEGARIGRDCNVCDRCFIENDVVVGDRVTIKCGVSLWDGVRLENDVFVGPSVAFSNDPRPRSGVHLATHPETVVREGASLGAGAVLLPGITVGRWALVGAGAVVTEDVGDFAMAYGNPARARGFVCRCAASLVFDSGHSACACGRAFAKDAAGTVTERSAS
ncbi:MAG: N-acetyltransferase [Acidobacteriota bacterium]|nr:N-acetyltransferase [Acidobacteriota bacterium]